MNRDRGAGREGGAGTARQVRLVAGVIVRSLARRPATWVTTLLTGVLFALLVAGAGAASERSQTKAESISFRLSVDGDLAGAQSFRSRLASPQLDVAESEDATADVTESTSTVGLTLPDGLDARLARADPVELKVYYRQDSDNSQTAFNTLALRLQEIELDLARERGGAAAGGAPPRVILDGQQVKRDARVNRLELARTLAALVTLLCLGVVSSVAAVMGGSRENRTNEPLLLLPARRDTLVAGIALGAFPVAAIQLVAATTLLIAVAALPVTGLEQPLDVVAAMLATSLPAALLLGLIAAGMGCLAGAIGTGSEDAVSLGDFFALPFVFVGVVLFLAPALSANPLLFALPVIGPALALRDGAAGSLDPLGAVVSAGSTVLWFTALVELASRRVADERRVLRSTR